MNGYQLMEVYMASHKKQKRGGGGSSNGGSSAQVAGTARTWRKIAKVITEHNMQPIDAVSYRGRSGVLTVQPTKSGTWRYRIA